MDKKGGREGGEELGGGERHSGREGGMEGRNE